MPFIIISIIIVIILLLFSFKACSSPTYTITFKNYDDSVIEVIEVKEGELPKIDRIPTRDSDGIFEYIFDSWGNIVKAEKDTTYKAKFTSILIEKDNDDIEQDKKIDDTEYLEKTFPTKDFVKTINKNGFISIIYKIQKNNAQIILAYDGGITTIELQQKDNNVIRKITYSAD